MDNYILEIYEPNSRRTTLYRYKSSAPFPHFAKGDIIDYGASLGGKQTDRARVTGIEHIMWDSEDGTHHKLMVFTEPSPGR